MTQNRMHVEAQILAASALVRFCNTHQIAEPGIELVRACHEALEAGDVQGALAAFEKVPQGGNGCFNDWQPTDSPDFAYDLAVFQALVERWARLMRVTGPGPNNSFKPTPLRGAA